MSVHEPVRIEKLMSLTLREFQYTIAPLAGGPLASDRNDVQIATNWFTCDLELILAAHKLSLSAESAEERQIGRAHV